jgi:hypothetical protein
MPSGGEGRIRVEKLSLTKAAVVKYADMTGVLKHWNFII